jgi:hypothetical protein
MAADREPIEIDDSPELLRLVAEMESGGEPCVLRRGGRDVAVVRLVFNFPEPDPTTADDSLWDIVGMIDSGGRGDVATTKYKYLGEAYADWHREERG